uniref:Protein transport protein Sec31A n=1 Tax=Myripristis murdjan TaxID=586833 RepID=A0A667WXY8_9TELE
HGKAILLSFPPKQLKQDRFPIGVLAIAWSLADPELLLSCGKDSRILCWNPNTAEVLYELPTSTQWCFDIQWCPRNPAVLSAAAFDGHIDIYSIMGGSNQAQSQRHADQISNSFGNMDPFGTGQTLPPLQLPQTTATPTTVNPLKKPPKWICRPVGASFAFGGKLVSLENTKPNPQQPQQPASHVVHVSQVVTETAFLKRSAELQATISAGSFVDFCQTKIDAAENEFEKTVWSFLKVNFDNDVRSKYLEVLIYLIYLRFVCLPDVDGLITQALLTGDFEGAVELCLHDNRMADSIILAIAGGAELLEKTQKKYFTKAHSKITKLISAVVMKDWHDILQTCDLQNWREALAAVMTYAQPNEFSSLCDLLGGRLEASEDSQLQAQACLCYICAGNVEKLVSCWTRAQDGCCPLSLQELVEKVVVLRRAVEQTQRSGPAAVGVLLAEKMSQYANLLASQGSLSTAITYLPDNTDQVCNTSQLRDRLSRALGQQAAAPAAPVQTQKVQPQPPAPQAQHTTAMPRHPYTPAQPAMVPQPSNGWNDPPALSRAPKKKHVPENYTPPAPITAPIMAPLGGDPQAQPISSAAPQAMVPGQVGVQAPYSGMQQQQQISPPPMNPAMPKTSVEGAPGAPTGDVIQPMQSIPAEKITKKPIPDEHLVLKTTFEGLIQKCLAVATDPQTKRKLDDANKRLEALYDKLREQTLSPAIVGGLHNMARSIESRSYTEGLNIHTHIVSNSNFSETSAFMPVLKVVLTQANKLGV